MLYQKSRAKNKLAKYPPYICKTTDSKTVRIQMIIKIVAEISEEGGRYNKRSAKLRIFFEEN